WPSPSHAADYHVGPGQALATIGDAPWATLQPGDRVLIHWRQEPYKEKWVINRQGTADDWITIAGIPGPEGQLPVIDGRDAVTAPGLNFWNEERGIIKIGGSNTPPDGLPAYIVIEDLEIRSGRPPFTFTNDGGGTSTYADNAASIYVEKAEHLIIRRCVIHDSGNGIFTGSFNGQTRDLLIEGNHIFANGNLGSAFHHNTYTSAIGILYQFNRFGALRAGADGNNLKDRSAGLVVRYNWVEDGNRQLDLVDGETEVVAHPDYDETFVYGNVLIESDGQGNSQVAHYGGDGGDTDLYRKGTLYFYNNTVVSTRTGNTTLLRLSTQDESADVRNNVLYTVADGNRLAMLAAAGDLTLRHNWTKP
ncbi:MAG: polysaccharide-degrading enzyme, partial [bacterium]|nr:polysaccharide-degrading enzyme [bacterium]